MQEPRIAAAGDIIGVGSQSASMRGLRKPYGFEFNAGATKKKEAHKRRRQ
jgi:hypothetical protein